MKNFKSFTQLIESVKLATMDDLKKHKGVYIFVMGGSASGKNYWAEKHLGNLKLVDTDAVVKDIMKPEDDPRKLVSTAIAIVNKEIDKSIAKGISFVQTGTGANYKGLYNRLARAKEAGYTTALVLIDTDPQLAIKRNAERVAAGGHGATLEPEKIIRTNRYAKENYILLLKSGIVDITMKVKQ